MGYVLAAMALVITLCSVSAAAMSPLPLAKPKIDSAIELIDVEGENGAMDMTVDLPVADSEDDPEVVPLEPDMPNEDWDQEAQSGVAIPISEALSLGVDYEIEETEDLAAEGIGLGTANEDRESHNVMIRANIQFDLKP